jgi:hypothetical protein
MGIEQAVRAVPLPDDLPKSNAPATRSPSWSTSRPPPGRRRGRHGRPARVRGPTYDSLVLAGGLILHHVGKAASLKEAADRVRAALDSGKAAARVR